MFTLKNRGSVGVWALVIAVVALVAVFVIGSVAFHAGYNSGVNEGYSEDGTPLGLPSSDTNSAVRISGSLRVGGTNGSSLTFIKKGTCNLVGSPEAMTATTTNYATCAATGVVAGDTVFVQLASSTAQSLYGVIVESAYASTTSGSITVRLRNLTGSSLGVTAIGTSTQYLILR